MVDMADTMRQHRCITIGLRRRHRRHHHRHHHPRRRIMSKGITICTIWSGTIWSGIIMVLEAQLRLVQRQSAVLSAVCWGANQNVV